MEAQKLSSAELEAGFVEVRRAYRLLYEYQKRVLDLVKYIGNKWNFEFTFGEPWIGEFTKRNNQNLDNSPWNWMNLYFYEFNFEKENSKKSNYLNLKIIIQSDTGSFDNNADKNDIQKFKKPEESETRLIFYLSRYEYNHEFTKNLTFTKAENDYIIEKAGKTNIIYKAFKLSEFENENSTKTILQSFEEKVLSKWNINLCD